MKHTPGPWTLCFHLQSEENDKKCPCGFHGDIWADDKVVCSIGVPHIDPSSEMVPRHDRSIELANAHLIVAAPEMLEAVEFLLPYFESEAGTGDTQKVEELHALIAKARGES